MPRRRGCSEHVECSLATRRLLLTAHNAIEDCFRNDHRAHPQRRSILIWREYHLVVQLIPMQARESQGPGWRTLSQDRSSPELSNLQVLTDDPVDPGND